MRSPILKSVCMAILVIFATTRPAPAAPAINYQAKLSDSNGAPLAGTHMLYFSIYQGGNPITAGSGALKFSESANVNIANGIANHAVGTGTNIVGASLSPAMFINQPLYLEVAVDTTSTVILPRDQIQHVPFTMTSDDSFKKISNTYVVVQSTLAIGDPAAEGINGFNIYSAYVNAKGLTPNGQPRSATNRVTVLIPPGHYKMADISLLVLDTDFIDLVGLSSARDDQYIYGVPGTNQGVLHQTANDVHIENLVVQSTQNSGLLSGTSDEPATYFPETDGSVTVIRNCEFRDDGAAHSWAMRVGQTYAGVYTDVTAGDGAFKNIASGTFTNCTAGSFSFAADGGIASGTFNNCVAGSHSYGSEGIVSGTFTNCTGASYAFGGGPTINPVSGTFISCTAADHSFGYNGDTTSATFTDCTGGDFSFGAANLANGTFTDCTGGDFSFGSLGTAGGSFRGCVGGNSAFGGNGTASGTFINCQGKDASFGGTGIAAGTFNGCIGGTSSFAGGGAASGVFNGCLAGSNSFGSSGTSLGASFIGCKLTAGAFNGTFSGRMENCYWATGITCDANARIYGSTIAGALNLNNTNAGVTGTRAQIITNAGSNLLGPTNALAFNISDPDVN